MKKSKKEIFLVILVILFAALSGFFYNQSKNTVHTGEIHYKENSNTSYKVYLKDKKYYNRDYLDEGMQYISSIIDYIDVNFKYSADYDIDDSYNINKRIVADFKIVDNQNPEKVIYSKQDVLKNEIKVSNKIDIDDNVKVEYNKYNSLANEFKTNYGISADCNLVVSYYIEYYNDSRELSQVRTLSVTVPLSEQMISISKNQNLNNNLVFVGKTTNSPVNKTMAILAISFLFVMVATIILLIAEIKKRKAKESKYDNFIKRTLKQYDAYITEAKEEINTSGKSIINVESFKELLDVRNNIEKTIVYIKESDDVSKFLIIDNEVYEYKVTRAEMDK